MSEYDSNISYDSNKTKFLISLYLLHTEKESNQGKNLNIYISRRETMLQQEEGHKLHMKFM